jgi:hypothetical protein
MLVRLTAVVVSLGLFACSGGPRGSNVAEVCQSFCSGELGAVCTDDEVNECARDCLDDFNTLSLDCVSCGLGYASADCESISLSSIPEDACMEACADDVDGPR